MRGLLEARRLELRALREYMVECPEDWADRPERVRALNWTIERHEQEIRCLEALGGWRYLGLSVW